MLCCCVHGLLCPHCHCPLLNNRMCIPVSGFIDVYGKMEFGAGGGGEVGAGGVVGDLIKAECEDAAPVNDDKWGGGWVFLSGFFVGHAGFLCHAERRRCSAVVGI